MERHDCSGSRVIGRSRRDEADGRFFAIDDTCTHEQCSLAGEETLEGTVATCGCHGAQFDVTTGAVLAPPAPEPVKAYPLRIDEGNLVVEV